MDECAMGEFLAEGIRQKDVKIEILAAKCAKMEQALQKIRLYAWEYAAESCIWWLANEALEGARIVKNKRCGNCMEYDDLSGFCSTHSSLVMATDSCDAWEVDVHTLLIDRTAELSELNLKFGKLQALADWVVNPPRNATAGSITRAQDVLRNYLYELEEEEYEK